MVWNSGNRDAGICEGVGVNDARPRCVKHGRARKESSRAKLEVVEVVRWRNTHSGRELGLVILRAANEDFVLRRRSPGLITHLHILVLIAIICRRQISENTAWRTPHTVGRPLTSFMGEPDGTGRGRVGEALAQTSEELVRVSE